MSFEIQGFNADGDAFWSVGHQTWEEILAYLTRPPTILNGEKDGGTTAILIRRGPQIHDSRCGTIKPYRLAPARCRTCHADEDA